jgi:hypothetical protein
MTTKTPITKEKSPISSQVITIFSIIFGLSVISLILAAAISYYALPAAINKQKAQSEANAVITLKIIFDAQQQIKQNDKDGNGRYDYADLKTLGVTGTINQSVAVGFRNGYRFETAAGTQDPENTWWAKASPNDPKSPFRYFFMNHKGTCYASKTDFQIDTQNAKTLDNLVELDVVKLNNKNN